VSSSINLDRDGGSGSAGSSSEDAGLSSDGDGDDSDDDDSDDDDDAAPVSQSELGGLSDDSPDGDDDDGDDFSDDGGASGGATNQAQQQRPAPGRAAFRTGGPRTTMSSLAGQAPATEGGADISKPADWPTELPGAEGGGPSWIVGMHREPLWSDAAQGCSPFSYCDKGVADRGHKFQRTVNPYVDKRRTFDPYAQATEAGTRRGGRPIPGTPPKTRR
jgi:hypothetical protein